MTKRKLIEYIKHPNYLEELSIEELKEWIDEFPYSQNLRLLLAQKVTKAKKKSKKYAHVLQDAAIYSPDRAHVHHVLLSTKEVQKAKEEAEITEPVELSDDTVHEEVALKVDVIVENQEDPSAGVADIFHEPEMTSALPDTVEESVDTPAVEGVGLSTEEGSFDMGLSDYSQWLLAVDSRSSDDDDDDEEVATEERPVSETLAKLLTTQGHNEEAIRVYEKLILQYPEKSTYFAAQIEKIQVS